MNKQEYNRQWRLRNKEHIRQWHRKYNKERSPEKKRANRQQQKERLKKLVFDHYGWKCSCPNCPETNPGFLSIDHINGDGKEARRKHGYGTELYRWIVKNNYPADLQALCRNCNWGKWAGKGTCFHDKPSKLDTELGIRI